MLATYLLGLREGLEASLVVVVLVAYLVKSERRHLLPRVWTGVGLATSISLAAGALLWFGPQRLTLQAQEGLEAIMSVIAVGFVTWMVFWMASHARALSGELRTKIDGAADAGPWSLVLIAALAVGREGLETALFLSTLVEPSTASSAESATQLLGALAGIGTAVGMGMLFYRGALRINLTRFFTWTGAFLIVIAAGVLRYGVGELNGAGFTTFGASQAFDVSSSISSDWAQTLLAGIFNFETSMSKIEVGAWLGYLIPTMALFAFSVRRRATAHP